MNIEELREYCLSLPHAEETFPFDRYTLVFKVGGKMFGLIGLDSTELSINLKCDPEKALELRERYPAVQPGYHMSKKHWNTVYIDGSIPRKQIEEWIIESYRLVLNSLPRKIRDEIQKDLK
jgi:predicted DNA-binding protein (MmcQ/YjbR family)